jgi:hypothetical protein
MDEKLGNPLLNEQELLSLGMVIMY